MSSDLQHKLSQYEVPPPPGAWENIAAALDQEQNPFIERLHQYEVSPPAPVWERIALRLDEPSAPARVIPFYKRYSRSLKYSGVAAALILFAIISSLLLSKKTESETAVQNPAITRPSAPATSGTADTPANEVAPPVTVESRPQVSQRKTPPAERAAIFSFLNDRPETEPVTGYDQTRDKYMLFIDGDGNAMRLSKKLFNAFACASYDYVCRQRISALQARVASTAVTTDFTGILDILKNLQENQ